MQVMATSKGMRHPDFLERISRIDKVQVVLGKRFRQATAHVRGMHPAQDHALNEAGNEVAIRRDIAAGLPKVPHQHQE